MKSWYNKRRRLDVNNVSSKVSVLWKNILWLSKVGTAHCGSNMQIRCILSAVANRIVQSWRNYDSHKPNHNWGRAGILLTRLNKLYVWISVSITSYVADPAPTVMKQNVLTGTFTDRQYQNLLYKMDRTCPTCQRQYKETLTIKIPKQGKNAFSITPPSYFLHINESLCFIDALRSNSPTSRKWCVDTMFNKFNIWIKGLANHYFAIKWHNQCHSQWRN